MNRWSHGLNVTMIGLCIWSFLFFEVNVWSSIVHVESWIYCACLTKLNLIGCEHVLFLSVNIVNDTYSLMCTLCFPLLALLGLGLAPGIVDVVEAVLVIVVLAPTLIGGIPFVHVFLHVLLFVFVPMLSSTVADWHSLLNPVVQVTQTVLLPLAQLGLIREKEVHKMFTCLCIKTNTEVYNNKNWQLEGEKKFTPLCVTRNTEGTKKATAGLKMLESTKKAVEDEALGEKKWRINRHTGMQLTCSTIDKWKSVLYLMDVCIWWICVRETVSDWCIFWDVLRKIYLK